MREGVEFACMKKRDDMMTVPEVHGIELHIVYYGSWYGRMADGLYMFIAL